MTELHQELDQATDEQPAEAPTPRPTSPGPSCRRSSSRRSCPGTPTAEHAAAVLDPAVNAVLDRLGAVRQMPVSGHGEVYAGMHDALLEALNEDVAGHAGVARRIHAAGNGGS